ncbi:MAG: hypothetical protein INR66_12755 [Gordonia polyisoprenivorans]|nr:hypothetical protein [Gordonia polyisoprenivorans]
MPVDDNFVSRSALKARYSMSENTVKRFLREHDQMIRRIYTPGGQSRYSAVDVETAFGLRGTR